MSGEIDSTSTKEPQLAKTTDNSEEVPGSSKKNQTNQPKLNQYNRIKIMDHLMEKGCDAKACSNFVRKCKVSPDETEKFVNEKAQAAQQNVHEECDSICYKNINSWLEYYKEKNYQKESNFESALIMIAISDMEHHPDPKETGGVDFQKIYRFIGDVMLGNPTPELNQESKDYLGQEFEFLINMANTGQGDEDTKNLHEDIETKSRQITPALSAIDKKRRKEFGSLDPMGIDKFISSTKRDK